MVMLIKNIIFHYDNDEFRVRNYIETITHTKRIFKKGKILEIFSLFCFYNPSLIDYQNPHSENFIFLN